MLGRKISQAQRIREDSDYDDEYEPSLEKTEQQIETAQELIELVEDYINNYYKIGILSLSAIFLFFTIFFTIIIIKDQSKRKKHLYNKKD